jgi:hypothetical protein
MRSFDRNSESRYTAGTNGRPLLFSQSSSQRALKMTTKPDQRDLVREAKAIVALAFRNGPIEDLHAGKPCPACKGKAGYSRISDAEMKVIMKNAVNQVYKLLRLKADDPEGYERQIAFGERYTLSWDDPEQRKERRHDEGTI